MSLARQPKQFGVHARHKLLSQGSELWGKVPVLLIPRPRSSADRAAGFYPAFVACSNHAGASIFTRLSSNWIGLEAP